MTSATAVGKKRRLSRLFCNASGRILITPLDDSLLAGPTLGLERIREKLQLILEGSPDAIVGFKGLLLRHADLLTRIPFILNVTASTTRSQHTRKVLISDVQEAIALGADAVAVHVNISSRFEHEMLAILGCVARQCELAGMPLLTHMYARCEAGTKDDNHERLRSKDRRAFAELIAHAGRVGVEAGADLVKTQYTGDPESFRFVVESCAPVPIVIAGGPPVSPKEMLQIAADAMRAGAAGVSFGRNVFSRSHPRAAIAALRMIVHHAASPEQAIQEHPQLRDGSGRRRKSTSA